MKYKKFIIAWRVISGVVCVVLAITLLSLSSIKPAILDYEAESEYYSYNDTYSLDLTVCFSSPAKGEIRIVFYDKSGNVVDSEIEHVYGTEQSTFYLYNIDGDADTYDVIDVGLYYDVSVWVCLSFFTIIIFLFSFILKYKEYNYNDKKIAVYAGWFKQVLLIDDVVCDTHHGSTFGFTCLSADVDGQLLEVKVSSFNKIFVRVGNTPLNA